MASFDPHTDEMLSRLAQKHEGLEDFLSSIFGFFERRTDLFHVMESKTDRMGFPPGVAKTMVEKQFERYQEVYQKRTGNRVAEELERTAIRRSGSTTSQSSGAATSGADKSTSKRGTAQSGGSSSSRGPIVGTAGASSSSMPPAPAPTEGKENADPKKTSAQMEKFNHISTWNGAVTDKYRWSQSLEEVTVEFLVTDDKDKKVKSKDLKIDIQSERVKVKYLETVIIEDKLFERIEPNQSIWNLEDGNKVVLSLEKIRKTWWKAVFQDGPEIDTTKVESVKKVEDYDGETQGAIRKIVFDQNQKHQGKPTSDQIKTAELMKDAWNAESSPFRGQPFDPSMLNLTNQLHPNIWDKS
ncbi:unnamed protein product [Amoebophrya sp. A25]|nr:unnamed protein product [Amoebophrya sp. A25]|eukprot:GSA25T00005769001.1